MNTCIFIFIYLCMYTFISLYTHILIYIYIMFFFKLFFIHIYLYIYIFIYVLIYIFSIIAFAGVAHQYSYVLLILPHWFKTPASIFLMLTPKNIFRMFAPKDTLRVVFATSRCAAPRHELWRWLFYGTNMCVRVYIQNIHIL